VFSALDCTKCRVVRDEQVVLQFRTYDLANGSNYAARVKQEKRVGAQERVTIMLFVGGHHPTETKQCVRRAAQVVKEALAERFRVGA